MPSQDITYTTRDGEEFTGRLSLPEGGGPAPGILMITAIFGIDDEMKELADAWAADGFVVSTPDIFWRQHPGPTADMDVAFKRYGEFDREQGMKDIEDLMNDLRGRPECNGKVAVLGFCFGGLYAHLAAAELGADAAGAYHGTAIGTALDQMPPKDCPVSFHFGDQDHVVPMEEVDAIKAAYADHPNAEMAVYEGAGHNFAMPYKDGYVESVCQASRAAVLQAFNTMK
jgi:carboxymethylenebutenolidase